MTDGSTVQSQSNTQSDSNKKSQQQILADYLLTGWRILEVCSDYKAVLLINNKTSEQKLVNFEQSGAFANSSIQLDDNFSQNLDNFSQSNRNSLIPSSSVNISCQGNACTENNSTTFGDGVSDKSNEDKDQEKEVEVDANSTAATKGDSRKERRVQVEVPKANKSRSLIVEAGSQHHHKNRKSMRTSSNNSNPKHFESHGHHNGHHNGHHSSHLNGHHNGHHITHHNGHHTNTHNHHNLPYHLQDIRRISSPGLLVLNPVVRPNNRHSLDVPGPESVKEGQLVSEAVARLGEESLKKKEQARFDTNAAEEAERGSVVVNHVEKKQNKIFIVFRIMRF